MLRIYKSSAGSGKTYTLVKEYIRIALTPRAPSDEVPKRTGDWRFKHILAITFTNKAANEMKERIIQTLTQVKDNAPKAKQLITELAKETGLDEAIVIDKAGKMLRSMLHNYSDLSVSTIDSFVHRVIRAFTYDLHLPMSFEVEMDRDRLLAETIEILMDRLGGDDNPVSNAVVEFAESKIEEGKSWNPEFDLINLARELFNEDAYQHLEQLSAFDLNKTREIRAGLYQFSGAFEKKVFEEGEKALQLIAGKGLDVSDFYQTNKGIFGYFAKYAAGEFPKDILGNSYVLKTLNEDKWVAGKAPEHKITAVESIKAPLRSHYTNIAGYFEKQGPDYFLAKLLQRNFYAFILLADIQKLMDEYKRENNILHISEFQRKVHAIVKEQDAPVIYERLGDWYDNILIDEHQDTSVLQWQNLLPLVENTQFKDEDSLVVGDGKQAIYRFRNGKVEQFAVLPKIYGSENDSRLKERETAIKNYGTDVKQLGYNYRSRKEIVDFNNNFYNTLATCNELKHTEIYEGQAQKQGRETGGGYIRIEFLPNPSAEERSAACCTKVESIISEARAKGYGLSDIAVLTRSNKNGSLIASYLIERGIQVVSGESLLINNSPGVQLLLSVLKYFEQRENHIARAEMVYYMHLLLLQKQFRFEKFDFRADENSFEGLVSALLKKEFYSRNFLSLTLPQLIHELIVFFGLSDDDPFLQFFADEALVYAARNRSNIREFLLWWEEVKHNKSIVYPETLDAVKIMTIHKSKGLQFPVVILADADWPQLNTKKNFWVALNKPWLKDFNLGVLPVRKDVLQTEFAPLYEEEEAASFLDMLNLLYVATTRPEDMLYILSTELSREPVKNNSITALLVTFLKQQNLFEGFKAYEFGDITTTRPHSKSDGERNLYPKGAAFTNRKTGRQVSIHKNSRLLWSEETLGRIERGNLMHQVLKRVHYASDLPLVLSKMMHEGFLSETERGQLLITLAALLDNERLKPWFNPPCFIINERGLVHNNHTKVPDRIATLGGKAVVIDYKSGKPHSNDKKQVEEYAALLAGFGFSEIKKMLVYLQEGAIEEI
ncbi:MAG TPA: UvrD-helicase domain-containing protein [Chitinophagales bacterium]|nr:UvrD-helicase domain-containing protein [Chitinophagales bacterium]